MLKTVIAVVGVLSLTAPDDQAADKKPAKPMKTAAQVLGFGPQERLLIIHADDVGMCHAANRATIDGMEKGSITSGSIMMPCPWVPEIAEYCKNHPEADFGLHMTLNCEWKHYRWRPVAPMEKVPSLVDPDGYLWHESEQTAKHGTAEEVEIELRAQVQRALDLGIKPTHLDTHMGTVYARPDFFMAYRRVANEFGLPYMLPRVTPEELEKLPKPLQVTAKTLLQPLLGKGEVTLDKLNGGFPGGRPLSEQKNYYMDVIRNLKPGITQIILHPSYDGPELEAITGSHARRDGDFRVSTDPAVAKLIRDEKVRLLTWREIGERQAKLRANRKATRAEGTLGKPNG